MDINTPTKMDLKRSFAVFRKNEINFEHSIYIIPSAFIINLNNSKTINKWSKNRPADPKRVKQIKSLLVTDKYMNGVIHLAYLKKEGLVCLTLFGSAGRFFDHLLMVLELFKLIIKLKELCIILNVRNLFHFF